MLSTSLVGAPLFPQCYPAIKASNNGKYILISKICLWTLLFVRLAKIIEIGSATVDISGGRGTGGEVVGGS